MAPIPVPAKSFAIIQTYHTVAVRFEDGSLVDIS